MAFFNEFSGGLSHYTLILTEISSNPSNPYNSSNPYKFPLFNSCTAQSAARAVMAM
jgi:hypothetical protein